MLKLFKSALFVFSLTSCFTLSFSSDAMAQSSGVIRFDKEQIEFTLVSSSTGEEIACEHELLSHVPWWSVRCEDRLYRVDTWAQIRRKQDLFEHTLLYHVSEGVRSSGERLVQFKSHITSFLSRGQATLMGITSQIDVRNGQADLVMRVK